MCIKQLYQATVSSNWCPDHRGGTVRRAQVQFLVAYSDKTAFDEAWDTAEPHAWEVNCHGLLAFYRQLPSALLTWAASAAWARAETEKVTWAGT